MSSIAAMNGNANGTDRVLKSMDANRYATKKTIAQGMLDIALLTANASQLKYILQVGDKHEFYTLMLTLITVSIILQVSAAILSIILSQVQSRGNHELAHKLHHVSLGLVVLLMFCHVLSLNFGLDPAVPFVDNIAQGLICIFLGTQDINNSEHHEKADLGQNISLGINLAVVVINIMLNTMEMSSSKVPDITNGTDLFFNAKTD